MPHCRRESTAFSSIARRPAASRDIISTSSRALLNRARRTTTRARARPCRLADRRDAHHVRLPAPRATPLPPPRRLAGPHAPSPRPLTLASPRPQDRAHGWRGRRTRPHRASGERTPPPPNPRAPPHSGVHRPRALALAPADLARLRSPPLPTFPSPPPRRGSSSSRKRAGRRVPRWAHSPATRATRRVSSHLSLSLSPPPPPRRRERRV
jgi:hypothetical protein